MNFSERACVCVCTSLTGLDLTQSGSEKPLNREQNYSTLCNAYSYRLKRGVIVEYSDIFSETAA